MVSRRTSWMGWRPSGFTGRSCEPWELKERTSWAACCLPPRVWEDGTWKHVDEPLAYLQTGKTEALLVRPDGPWKWWWKWPAGSLGRARQGTRRGITHVICSAAARLCCCPKGRGMGCSALSYVNYFFYINKISLRWNWAKEGEVGSL